LESFIPGCGFEFFETTRYRRRQRSKGSSSSAKSKVDLGVRATRAYRVNDLIEALKGRTVDLTDEEDDALREDVNGGDFSCIANLGKNCFQLLLGPARFVNVCLVV
jgi:histone-lysine N-methyltransferase SUV420H